MLPGLRALDHGRGCKYPDLARDPDVGPVSRFYHKVRHCGAKVGVARAEN